MTLENGDEGARGDVAIICHLLPENLPAVRWTTDVELRFTSSEGAALSRLGLDTNQVVGRTVSDYLGPDHPSVVAAHGRALLGESSRYDHEADSGIWECYVGPLRRGDRIVGVVGMAFDVTEKRRYEVMLAQQNEAVLRLQVELEQFTAAAAHDLQEPLRSVQSFVSLLRERLKGSADAECDVFFDIVQKSGARMQRIIGDLRKLSVAAGGAQHLMDVPLVDVVREAIADLSACVRESAGVVTVGSLPVVRADPVRLRQVFQNLISNALKYRHPDRAPRVSIEVEPVEGAVQIVVRDNGIGFDPRFAESIFEPFRRLHSYEEYEGTGIGLAIVQKIVLRHGGEISASGQPGEGATFRLKLPLEP